MPFNGAGTFTRVYNWVSDKANGIKITASRMDGEFDGVANGLSNCITKDGQTTISANIPFANYKITGLGAGSSRNDSINLGQVQDGTYTYLGTTGGSADAYTLTPSPSITSYATTQRFLAKINATNLTTTPYLQISGIANPTSTAVIKKLSATKAEIAVEVSDLLINGLYEFQRNSTNDAWILLNPEKSYINPTNITQATATTLGVSYLNNPITIANNSTTPNTDIDFSGGVMRFSDGSGSAIATAMTKRLQSSGSWSAGNNGNMLLSGARANSSTYHLFVLYKTDGTVDYGALLGVANTDPNPTSVLPSGYTKYERRGSILTDASGNIRAFTQAKNYFSLTTPVLSQSYNISTNTRSSYSLTTPLGIQVFANIIGTNYKISTGSSQTYISDLATTDIDPVYLSGFETMRCNINYNDDATIDVKTNKSSQIGIRTNNSASSTDIKIVTNSWEDFNLNF